MTETKSAPNPAEIDRLSKEYLELKDKLFTAQLASGEISQQLTLKGELLKQMVSDFGSAHAEKSKLLHGLQYEVMATFGQTVTIDAAAVETFRDALRKSKQMRLLGKLFEKTIRWSLNPEASKIVRGSTLSKKLVDLFAKCEVVKSRTPTLQVRAKEKAA
jgi:hypothetical protein